MIAIKGKPSIAADLVILIINVVIDISFLISGDYILFFVLFAFTVIPAVRLFGTLNSTLIVNHEGVFGKIKKERFRLGYHEISSVSMHNKDDSKSLLIVSGYQSYSVKISNARAVRDAIAHNMYVLGILPAPMPTAQPAAVVPAVMPETVAAQPIPSVMPPVLSEADALRQRIYQTCKRETEGITDKFYVYGEIPHKKLEKATKSYAPSLGADRGEEIILLYDDTAGGSGKDGFILTSKALYSRSFGNKPAAAAFQNIIGMTGESKPMRKYVITVGLDTGEQLIIEMTGGIDNEDKAAVLRALDQTMYLLKTANNTQLT